MALNEQGGAPPAAVPENLSYEEAFQQLERILARLENGDLPLEESLALFEQGAALASFCARTLDDAELRVRKWQPGDLTTPLGGWQES